MTLANKNWLKNESLRMFLSGESQKAIGNQLKVSDGTVSNLITEIIRSDDTADLQRQIAIVAKKERVSIPQIAANLRYKNLIKLNMLDERKSEKFLNALDLLCNKYSIPLSDSTKQIFSIIEIMLRENVEPHKLEEIIKSAVDELRELERRIKSKSKLLEDTKVKVDEEQKRLKIKEKELNAFRQIMSLLEMYNYSEFSSEYGAVARALIDIKKMGYDPKVIVSKFEKIMQYYKRKQEEEQARGKDYENAFKKFSDLIKDGLKEEDIFAVVHILKNDFPKTAVKQLIEDISTYGKIDAAILKLKGELESYSQLSFES